MKATLLQSLDVILSRDKTMFQRASPVSLFESRLASAMLDQPEAEHELALESVIESMFLEAQETLAALKWRIYPFRLGVVYRTSLQLSRLQKRARLPALIQQVAEVYEITATFSERITQLVLDLSNACVNGKTAVDISFMDAWSLHSTLLARRAVLLGLARAWTQENCEEPLLWKISAALQDIAEVGSFYAVSQAFCQVWSAGAFQQNGAGWVDSIPEFLIALNDDKSGNVLDNLLLSQITYNSMLDDGWKPDRWEVENLPMSIGMLLDFLEKKGFRQINTVGDVLEINLQDATEKYRYRGSPFLTSDDLKRVKVVIPGWEFKDALIIRPKVSEVSI